MFTLLPCALKLPNNDGVVVDVLLKENGAALFVVCVAVLFVNPVFVQLKFGCCVAVVPNDN